MQSAASSNGWNILGRRAQITLILAIGASILAGILSFSHANAVITFVVAGVALAVLAALVGQGTDQVGEHLGPGATGVLQSSLGNLPELFVGIFALRAGLVQVVQAALVGSILANSLLVMGLAFLIGGLRHGTQKFGSDSPKMMVTLTLLAVASLTVPTLAFQLHTPASQHEEALSVATAIVLLIVFIASIPVSIKGDPNTLPPEPKEAGEAAWPLWLAGVVLGVGALGAAFVSDWFVNALTPAIATLHLSETFTGLIIVALAGNAVENVVGIQFAAKNKPDYAVSVIMNSSLQVALGLVPVLVLLSFVLGGAHLTLVLAPLLLAALALSAILGTFVVYDGESTWLEGLSLIGLYVMIALSFWWG